jgi:hypothetical protein
MAGKRQRIFEANNNHNDRYNSVCPFSLFFSEDKARQDKDKARPRPTQRPQPEKEGKYA